MYIFILMSCMCTGINFLENNEPYINCGHQLIILIPFAMNRMLLPPQNLYVEVLISKVFEGEDIENS